MILENSLEGVAGLHYVSVSRYMRELNCVKKPYPLLKKKKILLFFSNANFFSFSKTFH